MSALARRDRRALWVGALTLGVTLLWRGVIQPMTAAVAHAEARADAAAALLAREQEIVHNAPSLPARLGVVRRQFDSAATRLFVAGDPVGAQQAFQGWLQTAAQRAGLTALHIESAPATAAAGGLVALQVEVRGRASTRALAAWLADLERGQRVMSIEQLDVIADETDGLAVSASVRTLARVGVR